MAAIAARLRLAMGVAAALAACNARSLPAQDPNTLTDAEKQAGFQLLFNGRDLQGWEQADDSGKAEDGPWKVENGTIYFRPDSLGSPALSWRKAIPPDFELRFEWKEARRDELDFSGQLAISTFGAMTPNGWSGSFVSTYLAGERGICLRTDTVDVPIKFAGVSTSSPPPALNATRPAGEWNAARIAYKGPLIQHWLNGEKVLELDLRGGGWLRVENEPGNPLLAEWLGVRRRGLVLEIENSDNPAWFRGIKLRSLARDAEIGEGSKVSDAAESQSQ